MAKSEPKPKCIVEECLSKPHSNNHPHVKYFNFPFDLDARNQWIKKLASGMGVGQHIVRHHLRRFPRPRVCSLHFEKNGFSTDSNGLLLLSDANIIPFLNLDLSRESIVTETISFKENVLTVGIPIIQNTEASSDKMSNKESANQTRIDKSGTENNWPVDKQEIKDEFFPPTTANSANLEHNEQNQNNANDGTNTLDTMLKVLKLQQSNILNKLNLERIEDNLNLFNDQSKLGGVPSEKRKKENNNLEIALKCQRSNKTSNKQSKETVRCLLLKTTDSADNFDSVTADKSSKTSSGLSHQNTDNCLTKTKSEEEGESVDHLQVINKTIDHVVVETYLSENKVGFDESIKEECPIELENTLSSTDNTLRNYVQVTSASGSKKVSFDVDCTQIKIEQENIERLSIGSTFSQKVEDSLKRELDKIADLTVQQHLIQTPAVLNVPDMIETLLESDVNVVLSDFDGTKKKRVILIGEPICRICQQPELHCNCHNNIRRAGGMCHKCGTIFDKWRSLYRHLKACPSKTCKRCNATFRTELGYIIHLKNTADAPACKYSQCKTCLVKFTKQDFKKHIIDHPNKLCTKCRKPIIASVPCCSYEKRKPVPKTRQVCYICGKTVAQLGLHMLTHREKHARCEICDKGFRHSRALVKHMRNIHNEKVHSCDTCNKKFGRPAALREHTRLVHLQSTIATCTICNKNFARKDYYQKHLRVYHSSRPPPPPKSPRTRPKKGNGLDNQPVICNICKKVLPRKLMSRHLLVHFSKMFKCKHCDFTFSEPFHRNKHEKLHDNPDYKFRCKICYAVNETEADLQKHLKKSHVKEPKNIYQCFHCNEKFRRKYLLRVHLDEHMKDSKIDTLSKEVLQKCFTAVVKPTTTEYDVKDPPVVED